MSGNFDDVHTEWRSQANKLLDRDYEVVSKLLVSQLLIEHQITKFLERKCPTLKFKNFYGKVQEAKRHLLHHPTHSHVYKHFLAAADCLRKVRNQLVHNISYMPTEQEFEPLREAINAMIDIVFADDPQEAEQKRPKRMGDEIQAIWEYAAFMCGILHIHTVEIAIS